MAGCAISHAPSVDSIGFRWYREHHSRAIIRSFEIGIARYFFTGQNCFTLFIKYSYSYSYSLHKSGQNEQAQESKFKQWLEVGIISSVSLSALQRCVGRLHCMLRA